MHPSTILSAPSSSRGFRLALTISSASGPVVIPFSTASTNPCPTCSAIFTPSENLPLVLISNCSLTLRQSPPLWGGGPRRGRERLRQNVTKSPAFRRIRTAVTPLLRLAKRRPLGGCSLAWRLRAHTSALRAATFPKGEGMSTINYNLNSIASRAII